MGTVGTAAARPPPPHSLCQPTRPSNLPKPSRHYARYPRLRLHVQDPGKRVRPQPRPHARNATLSSRLTSSRCHLGQDGCGFMTAAVLLLLLLLLLCPVLSPRPFPRRRHTDLVSVPPPPSIHSLPLSPTLPLQPPSGPQHPSPSPTAAAHLDKPINQNVSASAQRPRISHLPLPHHFPPPLALPLKPPFPPPPSRPSSLFASPPTLTLPSSPLPSPPPSPLVLSESRNTPLSLRHHVTRDTRRHDTSLSPLKGKKRRGGEDKWR